MVTSEDDEDVLRQLLAGQATSDARFNEMFRRLDKAEKTAGEARDNVKELLVTIREQDALVRIAEVRGEAKKMVEDLRSDVVHANTTQRADINGLTGRVVALEKIRDGGVVLARSGKLMMEVVKLAAAMGGGALFMKLFGS